MSYYLQMDGVDDFIVTPSITCNKIEIDTIVRYRTSGAWNCMLSGVGHNATANISGGFSVSGYVTPPMIDGSNTYELRTNNTRKLVTLTRTSLTAGAYYLFSNAGTKDYFAVDAYEVKFYNNETLVAHYDMSTGTVQDQSGNGNHATLTGGTWVGDDEGTEPQTHTLYLSDSIATSDTISKRLSVVVTDTIATNEVNNENVNKTVNDSILTDDSMSYTQGKAVNLSDSIVILESISKSLTRNISDNVGLGDTEDETTLKSLVDNITIADSFSIFGGKSILLTDSITVTDSISTIKQLNRLFTESIDVSDDFTKQSAQSIKLYDVVLTNDEVNVFNPDAPNLIGVIHLRGKRELYVYLQGKRELFINLKGGLNMVPNQNFSMISGDTTTLVISLSENLVGASVKWAMKKRGASTVALSKVGSIVDGKIRIVLDKEDTDELSGLFVHECEVTDQQGNVSTVTSGSVNILADMI